MLIVRHVLDVKAEGVACSGGVRESKTAVLLGLQVDLREARTSAIGSAGVGTCAGRIATSITIACVAATRQLLSSNVTFIQ